MIDFTLAEERTLRQLLETVSADQEHSLDGATDTEAIHEATRAKRRAERGLTKLTQPRCHIQVIARRDDNGDSEIRLIPVRTARNPQTRGVQQSRLPLQPQVQT